MLLHAVIVADHFSRFQFVIKGYKERDDDISHWFSFAIHSGEKLSYFSLTIRRKGIKVTTQHHICSWCKHPFHWRYS